MICFILFPLKISLKPRDRSYKLDFFSIFRHDHRILAEKGKNVCVRILSFDSLIYVNVDVRWENKENKLLDPFTTFQTVIKNPLPFACAVGISVYLHQAWILFFAFTFGLRGFWSFSCADIGEQVSSEQFRVPLMRRICKLLKVRGGTRDIYHRVNKISKVHSVHSRYKVMVFSRIAASNLIKAPAMDVPNFSTAFLQYHLVNDA